MNYAAERLAVFVPAKNTASTEPTTPAAIGAVWNAAKVRFESSLMTLAVSSFDLWLSENASSFLDKELQ